MSKEKITMPGIVLSSEEAIGISRGSRTQIIKSEQYLKYVRKSIFVVHDGKAYALIKMGVPRSKTLKQFNEDYDKHKISTEERKNKWPRKKKLYAYNVQLVECYDDPIPLEFDGEPKVFIKSASLVFGEELEDENLEAEEFDEDDEIEDEQANNSESRSRTILPNNNVDRSSSIRTDDDFEKAFIDRRSAHVEDVSPLGCMRLNDTDFSSDEAYDVITEELGPGGRRTERDIEREEVSYSPPQPRSSGNVLKDRIDRMRKEASKSNGVQRNVQKPKPKSKSNGKLGSMGDITNRFRKLIERI